MDIKTSGRTEAPSALIQSVISRRQYHEHIQIHDIRKSLNDENIIAEIVSGLESEEKTLPSLLLWNQCGLKLFDAILDSRLYYPALKEPQLLSNCLQELSSSIPAGDTVIELGAGNMRKTAQILRSLELQEKHVDYYALDVSHASLRSSIRELLQCSQGNSRIKIQGLLGTYEDCASWLHNNMSRASRVTILWLGNSIANFTPTEVSGLLSQFFRSTHSPSPRVQMIIGIDGCQDQKEIAQSYENHASRKFILSGLDHANQILEREEFKRLDWDFAGQWNPDRLMHESFYVARRELCLQINDKQFNIKKGERIHAIRSGKWPYGKVADICSEAAAQIVNCWSNDESSYGIYVIKALK